MEGKEQLLKAPHGSLQDGIQVHAAHSSHVQVLLAPGKRDGDLLTSVCSETSLDLIRATLDFIVRGQRMPGRERTELS